MLLLILGLFFLPWPSGKPDLEPEDLPLPEVGEPEVLDREDRSYLENLGPILLGVDPDWEPYEKVDESGNFQGIAADLLHLVSRRLGFSFHLLRTQDWDQTVSWAKEGKFHVVGFLNQTPKREEYLSFTIPYFKDPTVLVTHLDQGYISDPASLPGAVVALPSGTSIEERLRRDYPNLKFILTENELQAFEMVSRRQADLTVRSLTMAAWTIRKSGLSNLKISGQIPGYDNQFRMGVRKDLTRLRDILDRGIATLTPLEVQQVVNRHIAVRVAAQVDWNLLGRILVVFLVVAGAALGWIIQLTRMNRRIAQREDALAQSEQRYRQLVESSRDGIVVSQDDFLRFVNPSMTEITGYTGEDLLRFSIQEMVHPEDRALVDDYHQRRLQGEKGLPLYSFRLRKADGEWIWVEVGGTVIQWNGRPATLNFISDISRRIADEERIRTLVSQLESERDQARKSAMTDALTGIPNRRHFDLALSEEILRLRRSGAPLCLIMIDIDQFKKYNDLYGHQGGDDCLRRVAAALESVAGRRPDLVARYGGEEFVVLLPETPAVGAAVVGEKLRKAVESLSIPHDGADHSPVVTISLGGAVWDARESSSPEDLIRRADQALYRAKKEGRNRYRGPDLEASGSQILAEQLQNRLVWHKGYESGNAAVDQEHKQLFTWINRLFEAEMAKLPREEIQLIISGLLGDVADHFSHEELILEKSGYPDWESHRDLHWSLVAKASDLAALYKEGRIGLAEMFHFLAEEVVAGHMLQEDRRFFPLIAHSEIS